ncbi:hypothetical protein SPF06_16835 [Sinomonas sp. JGH33]|uniref:Leucine rich repeat variant domain-containing protein n=1 Tax=Sinomonas terricola TaxID=3110330 RepID=A0ABU5TA50_9MICC|nr:hypothetical protein [Sinomonas sp. JGH33]MEA5456402.1 hypothetical protein [Sinomonas sp. JGH33]
MYWSIYDFLMLLSGIITLVIVVVPVRGIPARTRMAAGGIGGGLVIVSMVLASVPFFRYPAAVIVAPVVAILGVVAVIGKAVRRPTSMQAGEPGHEHPSVSRVGPVRGTEPPEVGSLPRDLSSEDLMRLAIQDRGSWIEIARHPAAYDGLLEWLATHGDEGVRDAVLARRSGLTEG